MLTVVPLAALLLLQDPSVDLPVAPPPLVAVQPLLEPRCPSAVEVEASLLARVPGVVVAFDRAVERRALLLTLVVGEAGGTELVLTDADGRLRLRRALVGGPDDRARKDCGALSETAALMVERYLVELDERAQSQARTRPGTDLALTVSRPVEPPARLWAVAVGTSYVAGPAARAFDLGLRLDRLLFSRWPWSDAGSPGRWRVHLRAGIGRSFDPLPTPDARAAMGATPYWGSAAARRWPVELGLSWQRPAAGFELGAGGGLGLDLTHVRARGQRDAELSRTLFAPQAFLGLTAARVLSRHVYLQAGAVVVFPFVRYDFSAPDRTRDDPPVFSLPTQRIQARLSLDVGRSF